MYQVESPVSSFNSDEPQTGRGVALCVKIQTLDYRHFSRRLLQETGTLWHGEKLFIRSCFEPLLRRTLPLIIRHLPAYVTDATGAQGGTRTRTGYPT